jgi:hypothetical protein
MNELDSGRPATVEELVACVRCKAEDTEDSGIPLVHLQGNKRRCIHCGTVAAGMPIKAYFEAGNGFRSRRT